MPMTDARESTGLAERLRHRIASLSLSAGNDERMQCTASFGIAVLGDDDSSDSLLARADAALYRAKNAGRNCVRTEES
jgi:diguanylate cyclase (GGDEF)-like protein